MRRSHNILFLLNELHPFVYNLRRVSDDTGIESSVVKHRLDYGDEATLGSQMECRVSFYILSHPLTSSSQASPSPRPRCNDLRHADGLSAPGSCLLISSSFLSQNSK
ncbi:hypothetical protein MPTK1_1g28140 [Marchantia polymorpha subsp. ruderalis]|uniref:Uncharacterized protein n=2 Tax=Marchantia polymorpha TaxID=3197 RepID=A0AAF6AV50_MARPO|nr:hypothetical protein MARPO_0002s0064 [Marchantia polymorpha]BBN00321.1 hypothetical protein Mp_1g28140 [Marchantia polymorpha subsp. ruderalis]|eukprot:PTQ49562.1 hypothetical protein MARPO_0002s0064 [Marchantia polymorpha]